MKNLAKLTAILFLLFSTTSCLFDGVQGNGNIVNKKRKISHDFVRIKVNKGLHVFITRDSKPSLVVEADENLHELITTEVENGTLTISTTKNIGMASAKNIHLSVENLNEILVSSGAEVSTENKLVTEKLRVDASSGAEVKLQLKVRDLTCDTSSGAMVRFQGKAVDLVVTSSSGSNINAIELNSKNCEAQASSGSGIKVNVSDHFEGRASSGAHIKYSGNPKTVKRNKSSGGSVSSS
jgi:hypothetical protein